MGARIVRFPVERRRDPTVELIHDPARPFLGFRLRPPGTRVTGTAGGSWGFWFDEHGQGRIRRDPS